MIISELINVLSLINELMPLSTLFIRDKKQSITMLQLSGNYVYLVTCQIQRISSALHSKYAWRRG